MKVTVPHLSPTPAEILASGHLRAALRTLAAGFLSLHTDMPRLSSIFAAQQRYMMGQVFLSLAFQSADGTVLLSEFLHHIGRHTIASRNTADAFVKEMIRYDIAADGPPRQDRRCRPIVLSDLAYEAIARWFGLHLATLDHLDGGHRAEAFNRDPTLLARTHPRIVAALLQSNFCAPPSGTFSLLTWLNEGGLLMDRLMGTLPDIPPGATQVPTGFSAYGELQSTLRISRTHLVRNLRQAEDMGSLGWTGKRGQSVLWVSPGFVAEYDAYQAEKLAVIGHCFHAACSALR